MYRHMAHLYDWPGALDFSESIFKKVQTFFQMESIAPPARILDLACGTGTLTLALAGLGFQMTGIDSESAMLSQAKQKESGQSVTTNQSVLWLEQDMRYFSLENPVDAVLCHYDSLNHLSNETELRATFCQVALALKPGGLFLFDLNTLENYQTYWQGKDTYEGPNYRLKTQTTFDETLQKAKVLFYADEYQEDGQLVSVEDVLFEQYFNESGVEKYLQMAGMVSIQKTSLQVDGTEVDRAPLKTFWCCKKED